MPTSTPAHTHTDKHRNKTDKHQHTEYRHSLRHTGRSKPFQNELFIAAHKCILVFVLLIFKPVPYREYGYIEIESYFMHFLYCF